MNTSGSGAAPVDVADLAAGLAPNTNYYVRMFARNPSGEVEEGNEFQYSTTPTSETTASVARVLHGQPGWAWVSGWVKEGGSGVGLDNVYVNVNFIRNGEVVRTEHPVVHEGYYETGYVPVGKGHWTTRTVFPDQEGYGESASSDHEFDVRDGVRILAKHSGKCMDINGVSTANGVAVMHGECFNPATSQNQVFTLVPQGSYFEIVARHSGKCLDVQGAGTGWVPFQQWSCNEFPQQRFHLEPVESAPIPTASTVTIDQALHGSPGFLSFHGQLQAGAYSMANRVVHVEIDNADVAGWDTQGGDLAMTVDGNGNYELRDFGLSPGRWNVRARFVGNSEYGESVSSTHYLTVKRGYLFVNRYSNQCLTLSENKNQNGAAMIQWPCSAVNGNGEVMSFWPRGNGWYDVRVNGTNRCIDVTGVSTADGAYLHLWDCLGAGQHNQHWRREPISGQAGWYGLIARHSNKCMDDLGWSTTAGSRIGQWGCVWGGNQQWALNGVVDP